MLGLQNSNSHQKVQSQFQISDPIYQLEDIDLHYDQLQALKKVNMQVGKGEFLFLTGVSGAGKTSLLKILSGEIGNYQGRILAPEDMGEKKYFVSQVFQDLRLIEDMSIADNLDLAYDPTLYKSRKQYIKDRNDLCHILGFSNKLKLKATLANGGLRQKVAIIRALLSKPDLLIADEPTSSLDKDNAFKLYELLNLYNNKKGLTVIWASHNQDLVKKFSGRILHLDQGKIVYTGHACFI